MVEAEPGLAAAESESGEPPARRGRLAYLPGMVLLGLAVGFNEVWLGQVYSDDGTLGLRRFTGAWADLFGVRGEAVDLRLLVRGAQLVFGVAGAGCLLAVGYIDRGIRAVATSRAGRQLRALGALLAPPLDAVTLIAVAPVLCSALALAVLVFSAEQLSAVHLLPWLYLAKKIAVDSAVLLALVTATLWIFRRAALAVPVVVAYLALCITDLMLYDNAMTLFEPSYLRDWDADRVWSFFGPRALAFLAPVLITAVGAIAVLPRLAARATPRALAPWLACILVLEVFDATRLVVRATAIPMTYLAKEVYRDVLAPDLAGLARNPAIHFVRSLATPAAQERFQVARDLAPFREALDRYGLPAPSARGSAPLGTEPFRRIILVPVESLSLDALHPYNESLPATLSSFYGSQRVRSAMFTNYYASRWPTINGLIAAFNSHPNVDLVHHFGAADSVVNLFRDRGFATVFMLTQAKRYQRMDDFAEQQGFERLISKEDFIEAGLDAKYAQEWGVFDRFLYERAVDWLDEHRDERVFMTVLGCDTHTPYGRLDYYDVPYPALPEAVEDTEPAEARSWLESIHHHDHDMGEFVAALEERGLWTPDTLLVLTADHAAPLGFVVRALPGYPQTNLARIPLLLLTPRTLPAVSRDQLASQLDLAPTLLHLQGWPAPASYWGRSLFAADRRDAYLGVDRSVLHVRSGDQEHRIDLDRPEGSSESALVDWYHSWWRPRPDHRAEREPGAPDAPTG